jgi:hypothetical protein
MNWNLILDDFYFQKKKKPLFLIYLTHQNEQSMYETCIMGRGVKKMKQ